MKKDRLDPETTGRQLARVMVISAGLNRMWMEALETGVYLNRGEGNGRPSTYGDPTTSAVFSPGHRQMRGKVRRAATLIEQAMERLEQAEAALVDGFFETDDEIRESRREKREAATQQIPG